MRTPSRLDLLCVACLVVAACGGGGDDGAAGGPPLGTDLGPRQDAAAADAGADDGGPGDSGPGPADLRADDAATDATSADAAGDDDGGALEDGGEPPLDPRFANVVARFEAERVAFGAPGASLALIEGGEVTLLRGFGVRHPDQPERVGPDTRFRIASCTKTLTAVALLRLVEQGRVDLDAPITTYAPDFDLAQDETWAPSMRVRHLLTHSSGISDYLELDVQPRFNEDGGLQRYLLGRFGAVGYLMAPSGRMYNYANPNFSLAALVQELVSEVPYRIYLQDEVLRPLGMDRTVLLPDEVLADADYATGLSRDRTGAPWLVAPDTYDNGWGRPAGFAFSTARDLARYVQFLRAGAAEVLGPALHDAMQQPQQRTEEMLDYGAYGFGLLVSDGWFCGSDGPALCTTRLVTHNGAIPGFSAEFFYLPELDFGMATLASTDGAYFGGTFVWAARELAGLGPGERPPATLRMEPADYPRYAATFLDEFELGEINVTVDGGRLRVALPDLDAAGVDYSSELEPIWTHNFVLTVNGQALQATFLFDEEGQVEYLRTRYAVGRRVPPTPEEKATRSPRPLPRLREFLRRLPEEDARVRRLRRAAAGRL